MPFLFSLGEETAKEQVVSEPVIDEIVAGSSPPKDDQEIIEDPSDIVVESNKFLKDKKLFLMSF